ncbi:hypothetical protein OsJ_01640 [Oryza sativa Japonica Group]|uniref:VWFA domain-containing protein n=1 Tax=Oryza sativa subsp. japonica TaxID=39947 RepID=A2ZSS4_ORYSJ|nr:hypothetical protein OsJ_01640 [Oryza sativa Japonica Group]
MSQAQAANTVQVTAYAKVDAVHVDAVKQRPGVPVLVRVVAPPPAAASSERAPIDLVAVLDVSCCGGLGPVNRMDLLKKAMGFVIDKLGEHDRLAVVPVQASAAIAEKHDLVEMNAEGRKEATRMVQSSLTVTGENKLSTALKKAATILEGRKDHDKKRPGFIVLISDGDDASVLNDAMNLNCSVHAFGFRDAHNARAMHRIANTSAGTYGILNDGHDGLADAFVTSVGNITSIVAVDAEVSVSCSGAESTAAKLTAIESGRFKHDINGGGKRGTIQAGALQAARRLPGPADELTKQWSLLKKSEFAKEAAPACFVSALDAEMSEMEATLRRSSGMSYMLSWQTCHSLQHLQHARSSSSPSATTSVAAAAKGNGGASAVAAAARQSFTAGGAAAMGKFVWSGAHHGGGGGGGERKRKYQSSEMEMIEQRLAYWTKVKCELPPMHHDGECPDHMTTIFRDASRDSIDRAMFHDVFLAPVSALASDKVQLSTFPRVDAIPRRECHPRLPVLVRVAVPATAARRAPVDLVTLLDISCGGGGGAPARRLDLLRKAMDLVIGNLGADDRLAIVPFHSSVVDATGLLEMSVEGRGVASRKVQSLAVAGGTKLFPALNAAVEILEARCWEAKRERVGAVVLISDGDDRTIFREAINPRYPVHAFGFRGAHDARAVHHVADHTSGVYGVLDDEHDRVTDAFAACVRRVTSVVAVDAQVDLTCGAYSRASLLAVERSGDHRAHVDEDRRSGFIYAGALCAGDVKNFLVYVDVDREADGGGVTELLTAHGTYMDAARRKETTVHLDERMAVVQRRDKVPDVSRDVAAELVRVDTVKMVAVVLDRFKDKGSAAAAMELREGWCRVKASEDARAAGAASLAVLEREIEEMEASLVRCTGLSTMLSWLNRHKLQLHTAAAAAATARVSPAPPSSSNVVADAITAGEGHVKEVAGVAVVSGGTKRKCVEMDMIEERLAYWSKVKHDLPLMFPDHAAAAATAAAAAAAEGTASTGDHVAAVFRDASLETINRAMFHDVYLVRADSFRCPL